MDFLYGKENFFDLVHSKGLLYISKDSSKLEFLTISIRETLETYVPIYLLKRWSNLEVPKEKVREWFNATRNPEIRYWLARKFPKFLEGVFLSKTSTIDLICSQYLETPFEFQKIESVEEGFIVDDDQYDLAFEAYVFTGNPDMVSMMVPVSDKQWKPKIPLDTFDRARAFLSLGFDFHQHELVSLTLSALEKHQHKLASFYRGLVTEGNTKRYWNELFFSLSTLGIVDYHSALWFLLTPNQTFPLFSFLKQDALEKILYPKIYLWLLEIPPPRRQNFVRLLPEPIFRKLFSENPQKLIPGIIADEFLDPEFQNRVDQFFKTIDPLILRFEEIFLVEPESVTLTKEVLCYMSLEPITGKFLRCENVNCHYFDADYYRRYLRSGTNSLICPVDKTYAIRRKLYCVRE